MPSQIPLTKTLSLAENLISRFLNDLTLSSPSSVPHNDSPPPVLPLLNDSARLLKAHVTKLSLLAINKPFTPSAISTVLSEITTTCLPALMSAVQICESQPAVYASFFAEEVRARTRRIMREMLGLVGEVKNIYQESQNGTPATKKQRDSLSATGVVWNGCDELTALATSGLSGLAVQKAEAYRDMIKDAVSELQEWREGADVENEGLGDDLLDSDDEGVDGDRESLEEMFNAPNSLPDDREDLRELVLAAEDKLKKVVILYTAVIKRRLKLLPKNRGGLEIEDSRARFGRAMSLLKSIPQKVDEFASDLYDLDAQRAQACFKDILDKAHSCAEVLMLSQEGNEDEFTVWTSRWKEAIR